LHCAADNADAGDSSRRAAGSRSKRASPSQLQQQQQQGNAGGDSTHRSSGGGSSGSAATTTSAAAAAGAGGGGGVTRSLAAQVSFNHEKRQGWERPVLDDINGRRAGQGLAPVDKLTIQVCVVCGPRAGCVDALAVCWQQARRGCVLRSC
jgi:hypothetical protein